MEEDGEKEEAAAEKIFHLQAKWHMTRHMLSTHRRRKKNRRFCLNQQAIQHAKQKFSLPHWHWQCTYNYTYTNEKMSLIIERSVSY